MSRRFLRLFSSVLGYALQRFVIGRRGAWRDRNILLVTLAAVVMENALLSRVPRRNAHHHLRMDSIRGVAIRS